MTTFPITYIEIIIWLLLITYTDDFYWTRFGAKMLGAIFGVWIAIYTFNGEQWLYISATGVFTINQVKDGFQLPIALIVLGLTFIMWITLAMSIVDGDWKKQTQVNQNE